MGETKEGVPGFFGTRLRTYIATFSLFLAAASAMTVEKISVKIEVEETLRQKKEKVASCLLMESTPSIPSRLATFRLSTSCSIILSSLFFLFAFPVLGLAWTFVSFKSQRPSHFSSQPIISSLETLSTRLLPTRKAALLISQRHASAAAGTVSSWHPLLVQPA